MRRRIDVLVYSTRGLCIWCASYRAVYRGTDSKISESRDLVGMKIEEVEV